MNDRDYEAYADARALAYEEEWRESKLNRMFNEEMEDYKQSLDDVIEGLHYVEEGNPILTIKFVNLFPKIQVKHEINKLGLFEACITEKEINELYKMHLESAVNKFYLELTKLGLGSNIKGDTKW